MSGFEIQAQIRHQSNQMQNEIRQLHEWEKDMKQMEAKRAAQPDAEAFDKSFPLRNQMHTPKPSSSTASSTMSNNQPSTSGMANRTIADLSKRKATTIPNAIEKANEFKARGNECVKNSQYEKAVKYYTEAINLNKSDPVFYTNRALCYLKQSKFTACIDDCTQAIGLDGKAVKAYYRRMQAHEQMTGGDLKLALSDCKTVLQIEPKNADALRGLDRLQKLGAAATSTAATKTTTTTTAAAKQTPTQALWSQYDGSNGYERIDFITKAPHLQSKEPLKRIAIDNGKQKITVVPVDSKPNDNDSKVATTKSKPMSIATAAATPPPTSHIDQTNANVKSVVSKQNTSAAPPINLVIPKNSAQFHRVWSSLSDDSQKFTVLKGIYDADVGKFLGAQFSLDILREMFHILKSQFMHQNLPIVKFLSGIVKNINMPIISVMMNATDRSAFTELVEYMRVRGEDTKQIDNIQQTFDALISM